MNLGFNELRDKPSWQKVIFGNYDFKGSITEYRSALVFVRLVITFIAVPILFSIIAFYHEANSYLAIFMGAIGANVLTLVLIRAGVITFAKCFWLATLNSVILVVAVNSPEKGAYFYLLFAGVVAFSLFGYRQKWLAWFFAAWSAGIFYIGYFLKVQLPIISESENAALYTEEFSNLIFAIHFFITMAASWLFTFTLVRTNAQFENTVLARNEELSKTNSALDRIVYSSSHDLKAPLNSLKGLIDLARRTSKAEEQAPIFTMMTNSIANLNAFISDAIDASRVTKKEITITKVDVRKLIVEVVNDLRFLNGYSKMSIDISVEESLYANWDRHSVKSIFSNLISNAIKYHDPAKQYWDVLVSAKRIGNAIECSVKDNGLGISKEEQQNVFKMFYRVKSDSDVKGTGLGLYIVKEMVEMLKGKIKLISRPKEGSEFIFVLPDIPLTPPESSQ